MNLCRTLPEVRSLARPADGILDLGRLGLVLEPLIQGIKWMGRKQILMNILCL